MRWVLVVLAWLLTNSALWAETVSTDILLQAAYRGDVETIRSAVSAGTDLNAATKLDGQLFPLNVLMTAIAGGKHEVVSFALEHATFTRQDKSLALMLAIQFEDAQSVKHLAADMKPLTADDFAFMQILASRPIQLVVDEMRESVRLGVFNEKPLNSPSELNLSVLEVGRFSSTPDAPAIVILRALQDAGADPNQAADSFVTGTKETPLIAAARSGDRLLMDALKEIGATLAPEYTPDDLNRLMLVGASRSGNTAEVERLLQAGVDPSQASKYGDFALAAAASFSRAAAVDLLLARSADPNVWGKGQISPLLAAVKAGNAPIASRLLSAGAHARNKEGQEWPLRVAVRRGDRLMTQLLLDAGAPLMERDKKGHTILHDFNQIEYGQISFGSSIRGLGAEQISIISYLGGKNFDFSAKDNQGRTVLASALSYEKADPRLLNAFLDAGSVVDDDALLSAMRYRDTATVQTFLARHPDLRNPDFLESAFWVRGGDGFEIMTSLLLAGAELPRSTDVLNDMVVRAAEAGATEMIVELLRRGVKPTTTYNSRSALQAAVFGGHRETARLLFEKGADAMATHYQGGTLFHDLVRADLGPRRNPPIFAERQQQALAELISAGLDVEAVDKGGRTAFQLASGYPETQQRVISAIEFASRDTIPLHNAVRSDDLRRVDELRLAGANLSALDNLGRSALTLALQLKRHSIADYLLSSGAEFTFEPRNSYQVADIDYSSEPRLTEAFRLRLLQSKLVHLATGANRDAVAADLATFDKNEKVRIPDAKWRITCAPCTGEIYLSGNQQHKLALDSQRWDDGQRTVFKVQQILLEPVAVTGTINFDLTWTVQVALTIPKCEFDFARQRTCFPRVDIYNPNEPSGLTVRTSNGNVPLYPPTIIYAKQGEVVRAVEPGKTISFDRSEAPIEVSIEPVSSKVFTLSVDIAQWVGPAVPQPDSLGVEERMKTYSQLAKWTNTLAKLPSTGRSDIAVEAKTLASAIYILSARAVERNYPSHLRELLRQRAQDVGMLDGEALALRDAIISQSELSTGDIDLLIARIDQQLATTQSSARPSLDEIRARLVAAKDSIGRTNGNLRVFSEQFYSDLDRVVRSYQALILEYAQYVSNDELIGVVPPGVKSSVSKRLNGKDIFIDDNVLDGRGAFIRLAFGLPLPKGPRR